jgi:hypothetical protein
MSTELPDKGGRPTTYTDELADRVLDSLTAGESLNAICQPADMPHEATVRTWVVDDREGFAARYWRARAVQALELADDLVRLADEPPPVGPDGRCDSAWVQHHKTRVETRRWVISRLLPKVFGDRVTADGAAGISITVVTGIVRADSSPQLREVRSDVEALTQ